MTVTTTKTKNNNNNYNDAANDDDEIYSTVRSSVFGQNWQRQRTRWPIDPSLVSATPTGEA